MQKKMGDNMPDDGGSEGFGGNFGQFGLPMLNDIDGSNPMGSASAQGAPLSLGFTPIATLPPDHNQQHGFPNSFHLPSFIPEQIEIPNDPAPDQKPNLEVGTPNTTSSALFGSSSGLPPMLNHSLPEQKQGNQASSNQSSHIDFSRLNQLSSQSSLPQFTPIMHPFTPLPQQIGTPPTLGDQNEAAPLYQFPQIPLPEQSPMPYMYNNPETLLRQSSLMSDTPTPSIGKDGKKGRKKRNENLPKRPLSAYMYFTKFVREEIKSEQPHITFADTGRLLSQKWKEIDDESKAKYEEMAAQDRKRYEEELAKIPKKPKKPLSSFMLFSKDCRQKLKKEHPEMGFAEMGRVLGERWREASPEVRDEYEEKAKQAKKEYEKALVEFGVSFP